MYNVKTGEERSLVILKINLPTTISMKTSRRELSIDMVIYRGILMTKLCSSLVLPSYLKQGLVFTVLVLSVQKVLSSSGRTTRRWPMYFPVKRSLPA